MHREETKEKRQETRDLHRVRSSKSTKSSKSSKSDRGSSRTNRDRRMSSNNPFASALRDGESAPNRRESGSGRSKSSSKSGSGRPPTRPPKDGNVLPPSYEEAAGPDKAKGEYPREKEGSSRQLSSSRPHRSHSDAGPGSRKPRRSHRSDKDKRHHRSKKLQPEPVKAKNLDTIDKLDVTAFFGSGFHHDGPFDACTTHRNKNVKAAPVMAFPADGPNNSIKGAGGNINKDEQMDLAFGNYSGEQNDVTALKAVGANNSSNSLVPLIKTNHIHNDISTSLYTPKQNPSVLNFNANGRIPQIHGPSTAGLGSSTFLDGAPAPKATVDDQLLNSSGGAGGLGRKKSLVQRLRKTGSENSSRRNSDVGREREEVRKDSFGGYESPDVEGNGNSLLRRVKSLKVGRK